MEKEIQGGFKVKQLKQINGDSFEFEVLIMPLEEDEKFADFNVTAHKIADFTFSNYLQNLNQNLVEQICLSMSWKRENLDDDSKHFNENGLEEILLSHQKFVEQFNAKAPTKIRFKSIDAKSDGGSKIKIHYQVVNAIDAHGNKETSLSSDNYVQKGVLTYLLKDIQGLEELLKRIAKDLGRKVDDILVDDNLELNNSVLRVWHEKKEGKKKNRRLVAILGIAGVLIFCLVKIYLWVNLTKPLDDNNPSAITSTASEELSGLKKRVECIHACLNNKTGNIAISNTSTNKLTNIETYLNSMGVTNSLEDINTLKADVLLLEGRLNNEGIDISKCNEK